MKQVRCCLPGLALAGKIKKTKSTKKGVQKRPASLIVINSQLQRSWHTTLENLRSALLESIASAPTPNVIEKVCGDPPPKGVFYLVRVDDKVAGMGGIRFLCAGVAEIKRIYFRPDFRGMKLGERMLGRLLADAGAFGYQSVCLDTAPFMKSAHRLYEANGFSDCTAYEGVEVPSEFHSSWRFMQRAI